jgi:hypothetical protein
LLLAEKSVAMDWMFYLILLFVLFSIITVIGTVRYLVNKRIEQRERKLQLEKEAEQIAESNSGL